MNRIYNYFIAFFFKWRIIFYFLYINFMILNIRSWIRFSWINYNGNLIFTFIIRTISIIFFIFLIECSWNYRMRVLSIISINQWFLYSQSLNFIHFLKYSNHVVIVPIATIYLNGFIIWFQCRFKQWNFQIVLSFFFPYLSVPRFVFNHFFKAFFNTYLELYLKI